MVKTNIQTFTGEVEILSNLHVGPSGSSYLTANGAASNVLDITGNVGATFFVGDGGFLSNIATTLSDIVNQGNTVSNVVKFSSASGYSGTGVITDSNVGIQNTAPTHTLSIGDKIRIDNNTNESAGESVMQVDGRILATRFKGDGGLLSNIATTFESIVNQGNVSSNVVKFSSASGYGGVGVITDSNVGIQNTAPTHNLSIGSNVHVNDTGANVLTVHGNVVASNINMGVFSIVPAYGLNDVCSTSNGTTNVVQFQNGTTSLVASSNITASGNITAQTLISTANVEITDRLKFDGNVFVDTLRVADVAANIVTYDRTTGELLDSSGTFMNKFAVVSEQPPSDIFSNTITVANHGTYTLTTSNLATNSNTFNAFDGTANAWVSGNLESSYYGGDNVFHENNLTQLSNVHPTQRGDWLAIEFPYKTTLRHMKLTPLTREQFPEKANLYATNNDLTWTEIGYWKDRDPVTNSNVQTITVDATEQFKKYALVATQTVAASNVAIQDWQLFTESFSIDGGKVAMAQQAATGGETVMDQSGPHGRETVPLKKYPKVIFRDDKFESNTVAQPEFFIQAGYKVTGSGSFSGSYHPWRLFDGKYDHATGQDGWYSRNQGNNYNPYFTGSINLGTTSGGTATVNGEYVTIKMPEKICLKKYVLHGPNQERELPEDWVIYASNDGTTWTSIDIQSGQHIGSGYSGTSGTGVGKTKVYNITNTTYYDHYAMVVTKSNRTTYFGLQGLELFGYEEDPPAGDTSVDTTFTSVMNTPQTTGTNVYVDGSLGETFTNRVPGLLDSNISNTHTTYVSAGKYWELSGNVESNVTVEANTFLSGDAPHSVSVWVNSSDLESNASNSCIFSIGTEEKLDHISSVFSNTYESVHQISANTFARSTENSNFGHSCAINTDGTRMIVGCPNEDIGATNYGAVYIYTYSNGKWDDGYRIGAPTPVSGTGDQGFGKDVDISNDGNRVVVGAWYDDTGATDAGAAYVYSYSNGSWTHAGRIQSSDIQAQDRFGKSVAISGDGTKIIVGAVYEDTGATTAGAGYIFAYNGSSWAQQAKLQAHDAATGGDAEFGWQVAMNNDGTKVVAGAPFHDLNASDGAAANAGAAYVFAYDGSSWSEEAKIQASDIAAGDQFGFTVDINSDGTKIVVGSEHEATGGTAAGAVYVYTYSGGSWGSEQKIQASDKTANVEFGTKADFNTDGTKLIVGAFREDSGGSDTGAAYIFEYNSATSSWIQVKKLKSIEGGPYMRDAALTASDVFGNSVAMSGDGTRVVVGANSNDDTGTSTGKVFVYDRDYTRNLMTELKLQSNTWHNITYAYQGDGGSQVTYLDGRKVAEKTVKDTFGRYPPISMHGMQSGGQNPFRGSASTETGGYESWEAFDFVVADVGNNSAYWSPSAGTYNSGSGATGGLFNPDNNAKTLPKFTTNVDGTDVYGEWLQIEFPYKFNYAYSTIRGPNDYAARQPKDGYIVGCNNPIGPWTSLHRFQGVTRSSTTATVTYVPPSAPTKAFKYFRLVIESIGAGVAHGYAGIDQWYLYGHRENDLVRFPDPTHVLKYPHIAMTGPTQRGYVASASSQYSEYNPWEVFDENNPVGANTGNMSGWAASGPASTPDTYVGATGLDVGTTSHHSGSVTGEWIQIELPHAILLSSIDIESRSETTYGGDHGYPKDVVLYGSLNGSSWSVVKDFTTANKTGSAKHTEAITSSTAYKYYALVVESIHISTSTQVTWTSIGQIRLFGTGVDSIPIQIGGGNIDKVANFRVYDKFIEEDQALEIWDAQKDEFGRAKSSMTLQKGRLGLGTTEPKGRLAVLDEPHNLEEFPPAAMSAAFEYGTGAIASTGGGGRTHFDGYGYFTATAASSLQNATYGAYKAFSKRNYLNSDRWRSDGGFTDGVANNTLRVLGDGVTPGVWIKLEMPMKIKLYRYEFVGQFGQGPGEAELWASNDNKYWTKIHSFSDNTVADNSTPVTYIVNSDKAYKTYGLVVLKTVQRGTIGACSIKELRYFGTRERLVLEINTTTNPLFNQIAKDTSGKENHPTVYSGTDYVAFEKAIYFDGSDDMLDVPLPSHMIGDPELTFSMWVKGETFSNSNTNWDLFGMVGRNVDNEQVQLTYNPTGGYFYIGGYGQNIQVTGNYQFYVDTWYHICMVIEPRAWSASTKRLYVNGKRLTNTYLSNSGTTDIADHEKSRIYIGATRDHRTDNDGINHEGNFWMSNAKVYDVALTDDEVRVLHDMGRCDEGHHTLALEKTTARIPYMEGPICYKKGSHKHYASDQSYMLYGPNGTWGASLLVGATPNKHHPDTAGTRLAQIITTNGNIHIDPAHTCNTYLHHYGGGSVLFNNTIIHSSDDRLKSNEEIIQNATETLLKLNPQKYKKKPTLREDETREPYDDSGFMAQDIWYDAPELRHLVTVGKGGNPDVVKSRGPISTDIQQDPDYSSWGPENASLNYDGLLAYIVKSNQELYTELQNTKIQLAKSLASQNIKPFQGTTMKLWVTNENGALQEGDSVMTSNIPGYFTKGEPTFANVTNACDFTVSTPVTYYSNIVSISQSNVYSNISVEEYTGQVGYLECNYYSSNTISHYENNFISYYSNVVIYDDVNVYTNVEVSEYANLTTNDQSYYTAILESNTSLVEIEGFTPVIAYSNISADTYDANVHTNYVKVITHYSNISVVDNVNYSNIDVATYSNLETNVLVTPGYTYFSNVITNEDSNVVSHSNIRVQKYATLTPTERSNYTVHTVDEVRSNLQSYYTLQTVTQPNIVKYIDASGTETDQANATYIATQVNCVL